MDNTINTISTISTVSKVIIILYEKMMSEHSARADRAWLANFGVGHTGDCFLVKCHERTPIAEFNNKIRRLSILIRSKLLGAANDDIVQIYLAMEALVLRNELYIESREAYLLAHASVRDATDQIIDVKTCIPMRDKISKMSSIVDGVLAKYVDTEFIAAAATACV